MVKSCTLKDRSVIFDKNIPSPNRTNGTVCNVSINACYRSTAHPKIIYNPVSYEGCYYDFDCDVGLYCAPYHDRTDGKGMCNPCLVDDGCPEKVGNINFPTCKYGEYDCPNECAKKMYDNCDSCSGDKDLICCLGMICSAGKCINDNCKKNGTCTDDDNMCPYYGFLNGEVVFAEGQKCNTTGGREDPNCKVGTICDDYNQVCYYNRST